MRYVLTLLLIATATPAAAQSRADQIAGEFTKFKSATKNKHGVTTDKYREVVSAPWRAELRDYAGHYVSLGDPLHLEVSVGGNGTVTARGKDQAAFEIRNARIQDAVLYGTKVYRDGRTRPFEGGFLRRSDRSAPDATFVVRYGIGVLVDAMPGTGIIGPTRVFLEKQ